MATKKLAPSPVARSMSATSFLREVAPQAVDRLAAWGSIRHYRRGTYLCHQDEPAP